MDRNSGILHLTCTHTPADDRILFRESLSLLKISPIIVIIGVSHENEHKRVQGIETVTVKDEGHKINIKKIMTEARKYKPAVVHVHDFFILKDALHYARDLNVPLIYDVHEHFPSLVRLYLPGMWIKKICHTMVLSRREKRYSKMADHIITVVPQLTERFTKWHKNVTEIRNYPRKDLFQTDHKANHAAAEKLKAFARDRIIIIYAGNISMSRDLTFFRDTVLALNNKGYNCAGVSLGGGEQRDVEIWKKLCNESPDRMLYLGEIPHEFVPSILRQAHIGWGVLPDKAPFNISLPNKVFEYLACGLPVVVSDMCNVRHLLWKSPAALIFSDEKDEGLADLIIGAYPDIEALNEMKQLAVEIFTSRFTWDSEELKLLQVYEDILKTE